MKRILVPTDFSPTAEKAFRFAYDLAKRAQGTIVLYHTYQPVENPFVATEETRRMYNEQTEANVLKRMQRLIKKVAGESSEVSISTIVGREPLIDNILGFAEDHRIELIVMGTQGPTGFKKKMIGSVASRVAEKSDLPVLMIPEKYVMEVPKNFVFATNFSHSDKHALTTLGELATLYQANITVIHFSSAYNTPANKQEEERNFETYAHHLKRELNKYRIYFHLMEVASVSDAMESLHNKHPYDVMAMVRRNKTFLEKLFTKSFTQDMAFITTKPLLVIPEE